MKGKVILIAILLMQATFMGCIEKEAPNKSAKEEASSKLVLLIAPARDNMEVREWRHRGRIDYIRCCLLHNNPSDWNDENIICLSANSTNEENGNYFEWLENNTFYGMTKEDLNELGYVETNDYIERRCLH